MQVCILVTTESSSHICRESCLRSSLPGSVVEQGVEKLIEPMLNSLLQRAQFIWILPQLPLLLFGVGEILPISRRELGRVVGRDSCRAADIGNNVLGCTLHLRQDLDG